MAIYIGIIIGGFSGYVADAPGLGWRWAFDMAGVVGVIYSIPLFLLLKDAPRDKTAAAGNKTSAGGALVELLGNKYFLLLAAYFTLPGMAGWIIKDWMPAILKHQFDIGQGIAGVSAALYVNLAALAGAVLGGLVADRWMRRTSRGRIYTSAIGMCLIIPALFGVGNAWALAAAVAFLVLFGIGWGFFDCNNMPILCQIARPELRATGYGILNMAGITLGGFADLGVGAMRDRDVPVNIIFLAFALLCALSAIIVLCIKSNNKLVE